jgi:S-adenosylmethionine decarboxylase
MALKLMKRLLFLLPFFIFSNNCPSDQYRFAGKHFLASYLDCNQQALSDIEGLLNAMDKAVDSSGATILHRWHHIFPPSGLTVIYALSESHASIHTYPEFGACFVDLFTCGDHCSSSNFDRLLREYLEPQTVNARQFIRHAVIEDDVASILH